MKRKHLKWLTLVVALVLVFSACQPAATPTPTKPPEQPPATLPPTTPPQEVATTEAPAAGPKYGGVITFAMKEDVTTLDPLKAIQYGDIRLNGLVVQQLVAADRTGKFVGVLAERWETSPDGKEWTFHLRPGVKFHNGADLTAEDVKWIFDRILDEKSGAALRSTFVNIGLKSEVVDPLTLKVTIEKGAGPFLSYLALLNRAGIIHRDSYDAEGNVTKPIGTGPFMLDSYKPGESYTLKRFDQYWKQGEPYLDGVVLKVITDPVVRLNALRTGEVDMTEELPLADVKRLLENPDPNFTVVVYYFNSGARLVMNHTRPPFNDLNARMAVQYAFDREAYNEAVYFGLGQVHNQPFVPEDTWYLDVPMIQPDLQKAKEYFQKAGLKEGTEITMLLMPNQKDAAEIIDAMLSQVGFKVKFDIVDAAAWNARGKALDYDLLMGTMTGIFDPDRPYGYLTPKSSGNWLVGGYSNPKMDELLEKGISETDIAKRKEIYKQVLQLVQEDAATMYVLGLPWVEGWRNYVKGYRPGNAPMLMMMDASEGLNTAWLDK
ncbi:ABC transporter substrate-binding protein [Thermanaerothrix sp.]|jgi:peptide/nickel transport system substrate-binding protein|uniref:ABC transporter substrate-binding protein n=1 Tax=Thermanaerothrix sp. TaxID=2972675 RepID=UPI002ADD8F99|nr:ABC transporter substrate-binding protein [Thermanaerothrix sp.]